MKDIKKLYKTFFLLLISVSFHSKTACMMSSSSDGALCLLKKKITINRTPKSIPLFMEKIESLSKNHLLTIVVQKNLPLELIKLLTELPYVEEIDLKRGINLKELEQELETKFAKNYEEKDPATIKIFKELILEVVNSFVKFGHLEKLEQKLKEKNRLKQLDEEFSKMMVSIAKKTFVSHQLFSLCDHTTPQESVLGQVIDFSQSKSLKKFSFAYTGEDKKNGAKLLMYFSFSREDGTKWTQSEKNGAWDPMAEETLLYSDKSINKSFEHLKKATTKTSQAISKIIENTLSQYSLEK